MYEFRTALSFIQGLTISMDKGVQVACKFGKTVKKILLPKLNCLTLAGKTLCHSVEAKRAVTVKEIRQRNGLTTA